MIEAWWNERGGRICQEHPLTDGIRGVQQRRRVDALVAPNKPKADVPWRDFGDTRGEHLIVVQAKASQLAMPLLGQAVFSAFLAKSYLAPASVDSVLLCTASDDDLAPLATESGVEVVVQPALAPTRSGERPPNRRALLSWVERAKGEVILDFPLTRPRTGAAGQVAHAVVLPDRPRRSALAGSTPSRADMTLAGEHVTVVNAYAPSEGFGMYALGRAWSCARLLELHHRPASVRSVLLVGRGDAAIGRLATQVGVEVEQWS